MTPEEKAIRLFDKISWTMVPDGGSVRTPSIIKKSKECALICVDEIIDQLESVKEFVSDSYLYSIHKAIDYQEKVKQEINKL